MVTLITSVAAHPYGDLTMSPQMPIRKSTDYSTIRMLASLRRDRALSGSVLFPARGSKSALQYPMSALHSIRSVRVCVAPDANDDVLDSWTRPHDSELGVTGRDRESGPDLLSSLPVDRASSISGRNSISFATPDTSVSSTTPAGCDEIRSHERPSDDGQVLHQPHLREAGRSCDLRRKARSRPNSQSGTTNRQ